MSAQSDTNVRAVDRIAMSTAWSTWRRQLGYQLGFISFSRITNLFRLGRYLLSVHPKYYLRACLVAATSIVGVALRIAETIRYGAHISSTKIDASPIFIVGHWRSGTTHLHNLMSQDPSLGCLSMYQAIAPDCSLIGGDWLKRVLSHIVPVKRPMDNMQWPMDAPQEEEIPLAKMTPYSFYTQFLFPRETRNFFRQYVLFEGAPTRAVGEFKRKYHRLLQVATIHAGGKRLVLKNPVNTARVKLLLELYPNAKFVHIHRSPYEVYASTKNLHSKIHVITALQDVDKDSAHDTVLYLYQKLMHRFLEDRPLIPPENFVEVRFEDLERDPLSELDKIYRSLRLPGFEQARPAFEVYVDAQRSYQKNRFKLSTEDCVRVDRHLNFAFSAFGYSHREHRH